jgi:hypothetical protein
VSGGRDLVGLSSQRVLVSDGLFPSELVSCLAAVVRGVLYIASAAQGREECAVVCVLLHGNP